MLEHSNAALVSENAKFRIHHSFMPIRYREEVEEMQKTDNSLYRSQRRTPRIISPQDSDNHGGSLKFVEAPRAHEMVRCYLHDCEYEGIAAIRQGKREAAKLKANLKKNVIPYKRREHSSTATEDPQQDDPSQRDPPQGDPPRGKGKSSLRPSYLNAAQGAATRRRETDHRDTPRQAPGNGDRERGSHDASHRFTSHDASRDRREPQDRAPRERREPYERARPRDNRESSRNCSSPSRNRSSDRYQKRSVSPQKRAAKKEATPAESNSPFPRFTEEPIHFLKVSEAIRHFGLDPPRPFLKELTDKQLSDILRKGEIGPVDRDNHQAITGRLAEMHEAPLRIGAASKYT